MAECDRCAEGRHDCVSDACTCEQCITDLLRGAVRASRRTAKELSAATTRQPDMTHLREG